MSLTDIAIKQAEPSNKPYKLADGGGTFPASEARNGKAAKRQQALALQIPVAPCEDRTDYGGGEKEGISSMVLPDGLVWPSLTWWTHLTLDRQFAAGAVIGGFLGAIGAAGAALASFLAANIAIKIAHDQQKVNDDKDIARGKVIASYLFTSIGMIQKRCEEALLRLEMVQTFPDERAMEPLSAGVEIVRRMDVTKIEENLEKLAWLPTRYAVAIAAMPDMRAVILVVSQMTEMEFPLPRHAYEAANRAIVQLRIMNKCAQDFIDAFMPDFAS